MVYIINYREENTCLTPVKFGGQTLSSYNITNINENSVLSSENKFEKQIELTFESPDKVGNIQLSGSGEVKVTVSV